METIKELLTAGADIHVKNIHELTPLEWARFQNQHEAVKVLEAAAGRQQVRKSKLLG